MTGLTFLAIVVAVSVSLAAIMTGAWLAWRSTRNSGWIDTTWTFGLGVVGCAGAFTPSLVTGGVTTRQVLVAVLVAVWSLRLGLHIARRTIASRTIRATAR
jgi:steroid 5-alpha reductase family enzyme